MEMQIFGTMELHEYVRKKCVEFMRENEEDFAPFATGDSGRTYDEYLRLMAEVCSMSPIAVCHVPPSF